MAEKTEEQLLNQCKKLPLEDRIAHKNWKVRVDAYGDIGSSCQEILEAKDPKLKEYGPLLRKAIADSNAAAQERALDACIAFLKSSDQQAGKYAKDICTVVVNKCFTGRTKTVEKSQEVFLLFVELEAQEAAVGAMLTGFDHKLSKVVVPTVDGIYQALSLFGGKVVNPVPIVKAMAGKDATPKEKEKPSLLDHPDAKVRAAAKGLLLEIVRWTGKGLVQAFLVEKMRDAMKKEMEAELENISPPGLPTRRIRSEQDKPLEIDTGGATDAPVAAEVVELEVPVVDEYEFLPAVEILPQLKSGFWDGVQAKKWSDRKEAVAQLTTLASARKLAPGDYQEVTRTLKKLIGDINVAVAAEAITATCNLAKGLRSNYSNSAKFLLSVLLERFKEKKPVVLKAIQDALQAFHTGGCIQLGDVVEDLKAAIGHKVPAVKLETVNWITFCLENSKRDVIGKWFKEICKLLTADFVGVNDGANEVREASFNALAAIGKSIGIAPLGKTLEKLDEVKRKRLTEMVSVAVPSASGGSAGEVGSSASRGPTSEDAAAGPSVAPVRRSAASALSGRRPATAPTRAKNKAAASSSSSSAKGEAKSGAGSSKSAGAAAEVDDDIQVSEMSLEELEAKLSEAVKPEVFANLKSGEWKERLEGITNLTEAVKAASEPQHSELLVRLLAAKPGWGEKNFQVLKGTFELILHLAQTDKGFSKRCVFLCLPGVVDKVADLKLRLTSCNCLTAFCEAVGPQFVLGQVYKLLKDYKNPKVVSESYLWMVGALDDFGMNLVQFQPLLAFCKAGLDSSTAAIRTGATKLLGIMHKYKGPDVQNFLSDVKPALMTAIEEEFKKNPYEGPAVAPKKQVRGAAAADAASSGGGDDMPREDISGKIKEALIKDLGSPDWKTRAAAIESVNQIIEEAHKRIQPTGTDDLFGALKGRLNDSNKNLVVNTLSTLGNLAAAMGPAIDRASKGILGEILKCLADPKKPLREAVIKLLDSWVVQVPLLRMTPDLLTAMTSPKIGGDGRRGLFAWVTKQVPKTSTGADVAPLLKAAAGGLADKSIEVRKAAEELLAELVTACGYDPLSKEARQLPKAEATTLMPFLEKLRGAAGSAGDDKGAAAVRPSSAQGRAAGEAGAPRPRTAGLSRNLTTSRPGTAPPRTSKALAAEAANDAFANEALIRRNDSKEERAKRAPRKMKFDDQRSEDIADLETGIQCYFRTDLAARMASNDFKKHAEALDQLVKALVEYAKPMEDSLDLLLRWCVVRICENNTTSLLKVLEFLEGLLDILKGSSYLLSEYEAGVFLPCLVEKCGANIDRIRQSFRKLMRQVTCIFPASKLFAYAVDGLRSKNNRTRVECVDEVGCMIERHGLEIMGATKVIHVLAAMTAERDVQLRNAVLNTLALIYKILGDDIYRQLGKISEAQKSLIEEKLKWKAKDMEKKKEGKPGDARAAMRASRVSVVRENGPDTAEPSELDAASDTSSIAGGGTRGVDTASSRDGLAMRPSSNASATPSGGLSDGASPMRVPSASDLQQSFVGLGSAGSWREAMEMIKNGETQDEAVEGMKVVCHELSSVASSGERAQLLDYMADADRLVQILTLRIIETIASGRPPTSRLCKYFLNTLMQTFQLKEVARVISPNTLKGLVGELLLWLLDERVPTMDDGTQLLKALNVLMLKILENADKTAAFVVLIQLLKPRSAARGANPALSIANPEVMGLRLPKFYDLVVKCLIKLTKALSASIAEVDLDRLLHAIQEYLEELGMDEIRRRAGADDKPLRMVKTVLHELVKLRGQAIKGHLSLINTDQEPPPIIMAYIDLNLQTLGGGSRGPVPMDSMPGSLAPSQQEGALSVTNMPGRSPHRKPSLRDELKLIIMKIGNPDTQELGLYDLYDFKEAHTDMNVEDLPEIQNTSSVFRSLIRNGLKSIEEQMMAASSEMMRPNHMVDGSDQTMDLRSSAEDEARPTEASTTFQLSVASSHQPPGESVQGMVTSGQPESPRADVGSSGAISEHYREKLAQFKAGNRSPGPEPRLGNGVAGVGDAPAPPMSTLDALRQRMRTIQAQTGTAPSRLYDEGKPNEGAGGDLSKTSPSTPTTSRPIVDERVVTMSGIQERFQRLKNATMGIGGQEGT